MIASPHPLQRIGKAPIDGWIRVFVLLLAAAPRVWAAFADQGLFWPDEFYQSLEPAHRFAFGYGIVTWEWVVGARSWVFPGLLGLFWKALALVGVKSGATLVVSAKLLMAALGIVCADNARSWASRLGGRGAALIAGVAVALFPPTVLFGSKCMSETVSATLVMAATLLAWPGDEEADGARPRRFALAGGLAALAIYFRFQNGLVTVGLIAILLTRRRWRDAFACAIGATVIGVAGGLLDAATWGRPFHAFLEYASFHAQNRGVAWGEAAFDYYFVSLWRSGGPAMLLVLAGVLAALALERQRVWRHLALVLVYVLVHAAVPHKELRFIVPIAPVMLALSAVGVASVVTSLSQRHPRLRSPRAPLLLAAAVAIAIAIGFSERSVAMTFADLGHDDGLAAGLAEGEDSPWHAAEGINRLLWAAGAANDSCGVVINDIPWSSTGGYAYLHKDVPLFFSMSPEHLESANYLIARREFHQPWQYTEGLESRGFTLFRREGGCAPPPKTFTRVVPP